MQLYFSLYGQQLCVSAQAFTIHVKVARFQIRRLSRRHLSFPPSKSVGIFFMIAHLITLKISSFTLNVVRQTVSKWEKGLSVPDSDLLIKLAEILDVPVSRLLGSKIEAETKPDALAEQLSRINEQLAIKNRRAKRVWKVFAFIIGGIIVMYILGIIAFTGLTAHPAQSNTEETSQAIVGTETDT